MANKIQIKRSTTNAAPTGLANGELAYTANGEVLFLGHPDGSTGSIAIGGKRAPGTLTANQALVANSTSGIDKVIVANLVPTQIYANGAVGTGGQILTSGASGNVYWSSPSAGVAGSNSQIQFNANGVLSGDAGFTIDGVTDALTLGGAAQTTAPLFSVANSTTSANLSSASLTIGTTIANTTGLFVGANVFANSSAFDVGNTIITTTNLTLGGQITANGGVGSAGQVLTSGAAGNVYWTTPTTGDITGVTAGSGLTGGGSSGDVTLDVGAGNGITVASDTVAVNANSGLTANSTGVFVNANSGIVANSTGVFVNANNGIIANSSGVFADAANGISVDASGINVTAGDGLVANATGVHVVAANGISVAADAVGVTTGSTLTVNTSGIHVNSTLSITDLTLSGNLDINGTLTTVDTTNLSVTDSIISLARGQTTANTLDIGFYGTYGNATATSYSGLFRDATDGVYRLFAGQIPEPSTTVDTANVNFAYATLQSYLTTGALVANSSVVNITANSTVSVALTANSLSLTTALPATSGGTGTGTYTSGDLLVANTGNALSKLALGADGKVLQSNGTAVVYADLDGGTF